VSGHPFVLNVPGRHRGREMAPTAGMNIAAATVPSDLIAHLAGLVFQRFEASVLAPPADLADSPLSRRSCRIH